MDDVRVVYVETKSKEGDFISYNIHWRWVDEVGPKIIWPSNFSPTEEWSNENKNISHDCSSNRSEGRILNSNGSKASKSNNSKASAAAPAPVVTSVSESPDLVITPKGESGQAMGLLSNPINNISCADYRSDNVWCRVLNHTRRSFSPHSGLK